jgi:hypothetical protein
MSRWRGAIGTVVWLALAIGGISLAGPSSVPSVVFQPSNQPRATAEAASPTPRPGEYHSGASGFDVQLPPGWKAAEGQGLINRRTVRLVVIGNRDTDIPASTNPAGADWSRVPTESIFVELQYFGFPGSRQPDTETAFPLDWSRAQAGGTRGDFTISTLGFQHLLRPLTLVAYVGKDAPASDIAQLNLIVSSLRPEAIPPQGEYRGWTVVGRLDSFPIGAVRHVDQPASPNAYGFYLVRGARTVFAHIDHAYLMMGATRPCPIRYEAASRTFVCDATGDQWSRVGKLLTSGDGFGSFALAWHSAFVKDGLVLVGGGSSSGGPTRQDEAAEFNDPAARAVVPSGLIGRRAIVDRYSKLTSTMPITRSAAKLVPADVLLDSQIIPGSILTTSPVWVIAFSGDVRIAGSGEPFGRWTLFFADARTGGIITASCCGGGDWPPGFDALPDEAAAN